MSEGDLLHPASPSVQMPTAVRGALGVAQVSLAGSRSYSWTPPTGIFPVNCSQRSSCAGCCQHPKPGSQETNLTFPDLSSECPAGFSWERGPALGHGEKLCCVKEGFLCGTRKEDADARRKC